MGRYKIYFEDGSDRIIEEINKRKKKRIISRFLDFITGQIVRYHLLR